MNRQNAKAMFIGLAATCAFTPHARAGGFDVAIDALSTRVVKLIGLRAGLSAGYGSGVLISDDGLVVTTISLLLDAANLRVVTADGATYGAMVIGRDDNTQLALLRLTAAPRFDRRGNRIDGPAVEPGRFDYFVPGDSQTLTPGDYVIAAGNPFKVAQGDETVSFAVGVYSARTELDARRKTREFPYHGDVLVIDSITSTPGSPGGALVNLDGSWVGVIGRQVVSNQTRTNLNYAIPIEVVMSFVESVLNPGSGDRDSAAGERIEVFHGIKMLERGYQTNLPYVARVKRRSPARKAGVKKDDLIVSVDGRSISESAEFHTMMSRRKPGDKVEILVIRDEELRSLVLTLEEQR